MTQSNSIRNVVFASYVGAGKTSLVEALLFSAGVIPSMGTTSSGNTTADFEQEEVQHQHSMSTALLHYEYKGTSLNLFDTPGSLDFFADTKNTIHVADAVVLVIGSSGIRSELDRVWDFIQERGLPCLVFINELDKERSNFEAILEDIRKTLETKCVPIAYPIGQEANLRGVVDVVTQKAVFPVPDSHKIQEDQIPGDVNDAASEFRKQLVENAAETNDDLVEKIFKRRRPHAEGGRAGVGFGHKEPSVYPGVVRLGDSERWNHDVAGGHRSTVTVSRRASDSLAVDRRSSANRRRGRARDECGGTVFRLCVQDDHRSLHGAAYLRQGLFGRHGSRFKLFQSRAKR